jgi:hypothetical protein
MTTLANGYVTTRNSLMNLDRYMTVSGVADLAGAARAGNTARPAIVVSAGPSLARNIAELKRPGLRDRFVIIAVQTVLKTLLAEGIRPHFVTALDYHEVSRRFYEGLTPADVEGITLVAEPKANPAILGAFPGALRVPADPFLEEFIGEDLSRLLGTIKPGATVAHMAYYLARLLGCDPVILVGQDLGFTDGQYYAAGAAIHEVWSGELSELRTLEMMEWERIVRGKYTVGGSTPDGREGAGEPNMHRRTDVLGRPIYIDQQMATYLSQFERDFREDEARGLRVIDATEGGVAKDHAVAMTLAEAIESAGFVPPLELPAPAPAHDTERRLRRVAERVRKVRQDVSRIGEHSRGAAKLLEEMIEHQHDQPRVNKLIVRAHTMGEEVGQMRPAFALVQHLNQAGSLKRVRADRAIMLEEASGGLSPMARQRRELERDLVNVRWLAEAADELGVMLDGVTRMLAGGERLTGEAVRRGDREVERALGAPVDRASQPVVAKGAGERARIVAMIAADPQRSGLGLTRDLGEPVAPGMTALTAVLTRLSQCRELDGVVIVCENPERVRPLLGSAPASLEVELVRVSGDVFAGRARGMVGARLWSREAWRGGLGGLSVYDEACAPAVMAPVMELRAIDAAAVVGADWALVDPALVDAAIARYREGAGEVRLSFCQAPPGLGCAVVERSLMRELASNATTAGALASIGGRLSYSPLFPMPDPIANLHASAKGKPVCIPAAPAVRDCGLRFIADCSAGRALVSRVMAAAGDSWSRAVAGDIVRHAGPEPQPCGLPRELVIELCTGRLTSGARGGWLRGGAGGGGGDGVERPVMAVPLAERILRQLGEGRDDALVTFFGAGDPMLHPELPRLVASAKRAGIAGVHVRTDLVDARHGEALLESGVDLFSVDLMAETPATYRTLMGADLFERARTNLIGLLERRGSLPGGAGGGLPVPWIVPRITRCDAVYEEIETFYDRWILAAGAAVIDPLPRPLAGDRIEPLPPPPAVAGRMRSQRMVIRSDGSVVPGGALDFSASKAIGDLSRDDLAKLWKKAAASRPLATPALDPTAQSAGELGGPAREREAELVSQAP